MCVCVCETFHSLNPTRHRETQRKREFKFTMAVRGFLAAFNNIDKDGDHIISHQDLRIYADENNMPESFIKVSYAFICNLRREKPPLSST